MPDAHVATTTITRRSASDKEMTGVFLLLVTEEHLVLWMIFAYQWAF
jgi:hypothetical protein